MSLSEWSMNPNTEKFYKSHIGKLFYERDRKDKLFMIWAVTRRTPPGLIARPCRWNYECHALNDWSYRSVYPANWLHEDYITWL